MKTTAVIVAGGSGLRMKSDIRKQYLAFAGKPVLSHTLDVFDACPEIDRIVLAVPAPDRDFCREEIVTPLALKTQVQIVAGGVERQNSVHNGLKAAEGADIAVIHDGVRPFIRPEQIAETICCAAKNGACMLAIPAFDTLKQVDPSGVIEKTLDRSTIRLAQTPQTFRYDLICEAHEIADRYGFIGTDDASLLERLQKPVHVIPGSRFNIKITTPEDLRLAEVLHPLFLKRGI